MRYLFFLTVLIGLVGCQEKKSDVDLFDEGKVRVTLSADPSKGYEPLAVNFEAYLENRERVLTKEITEAKWVIKGPGGYFREVVQESTNYQAGENNERDAFYLDFNFYRFGRYTVKLILNDGEYISNPMAIRVLERETGKVNGPDIEQVARGVLAGRSDVPGIHKWEPRDWRQGATVGSGKVGASHHQTQPILPRTGTFGRKIRWAKKTGLSYRVPSGLGLLTGVVGQGHGAFGESFV